MSADTLTLLVDERRGGLGKDDVPMPSQDTDRNR